MILAGNRPVQCNLKRAGNNFRRAKSPVAPTMSLVVASLIITSASSLCGAGFQRDKHRFNSGVSPDTIIPGGYRSDFALKVLSAVESGPLLHHPLQLSPIQNLNVPPASVDRMSPFEPVENRREALP